MTNATLTTKVADACSLILRCCGGRINYALNSDELSVLIQIAERNGLLERRPELDRAGGQVFELTEKGWKFARRRQQTLARLEQQDLI